VKEVEVTLVLPGLADEMQRLKTSGKLPKACQPFLRRAKRYLHPYSNEAVKFKLWCDVVPDALPIAAITAIADGLQISPHWLRADPIHLTVDLAQVYHLNQPPLVLTAEEMHEVAKILQPLLAEFNFQLHMPSTTRWYLQCPTEPRLSTFSPDDFLGKSLIDYFPRGDDRKFWLQLFTEVQMLLQNCAINQARRARRQPTIDALWFWGNGELNLQKSTTIFDAVFAEDIMTLGLAKWRQCRVIQPIKPWDFRILHEFSRPGNYLVSFTNLFLESMQFDEIIIQVELLFSTLSRSLARKKISSFRLYPGDKHCYHVTISAFPWWWPWRTSQ